MLTVSSYTHQRVNHNIPIRIPRIWNSLQDRIWGRFSSKSLAKWTGRGMTPVPSKVRGQCAGGFELSSTTKIVPFCCSTQQLTYSYVEKSELVYCMKNMQIVTCWMRRHQLPHGGAKELPLHPTSHFGDLKPKGSVWLKAQFQSIQTQRKSNRKIYYCLQIRGWGLLAAQWARGRAVLQLRSQARRRQRAGQQVPITYKVLGAVLTIFLQA